ncbi:uncharacterized protein MONOS_11534 [Monocercomonoides exilis]|uniref:uncharacterized protein n=1 Tax=Monocercomonoides exilis TaxID=2049356 RepID=UPI00355A869F|nr:hypothetical protein MONOS_11534 [Monocercomonoides exilis]|eukprot:MONOS_11534.1-p1 / transcript=MONOS_11534.1 / gene=MONOS_11534 / organism=Monocercomonoides_exilis_PA203 / gene_product=unspecified product / transcript_product=unspecified product / location=Mono_scaffold00584:5938-6294(+) / protein_length=71 / sequence_SO=supercontig / SO=protein_coding / is_pseudo=false
MEGAWGHDIDRPSVSIKQPPGGRSSISFGDDSSSTWPEPKGKPKVVTPGSVQEPQPATSARPQQRSTRPW